MRKSVNQAFVTKWAKVQKLKQLVQIIVGVAKVFLKA